MLRLLQNVKLDINQHLTRTHYICLSKGNERRDNGDPYHSIYLLDARSSVNVYQLVMSQRIHYPRISILLLSIQRMVSTSFGSTHETERYPSSIASASVLRL
jgi:predicted alpha/beta superfamily hydrolase